MALKQRPKDPTPYPILAEVIGTASAGRANAPAPGGGASVGLIAAHAIRSVLGWRPRADDPKGFAAALTQSFALSESGGVTTSHWRERGYSALADLGAVTGAQASVYTRTRVVLEQALKILDGLEPLVVDVDVRDVESMKSVIRSEFAELTGELGLEGGPRVQRVNTLFQLLLGPVPPTPLPPPAQPPQRVARPAVKPPSSSRLPIVLGQLGVLHDRLFGKPLTPKPGQLVPECVNTVEDEQVFTDFLILVDYVRSLRDSWDSFLSQFVPTEEDGSVIFFGTELVNISRLLGVVAESVEEVYTAMDSVNLGDAERQTTRLRFRKAIFPSMTVAELLGWVERFATEEGTRLLQDAGKDGARAFQPIVEDLFFLVRFAQTDAAKTKLIPNKLPDGYFFERVQVALNGLEGQLGEINDRVLGLLPEDEFVRVQYEVENPPGVHPDLFLVGNDPALGGWSLDDMIAMTPVGGNIWQSPVLKLPRGEELQFKFNGGGETWDTNEFLPVPTNPAGPLDNDDGNHRIQTYNRDQTYPRVERLQPIKWTR